MRVCDELFKVRWNFVPGATGYDLEMSGNHRQSWERKMTNKNVNAWQFSQWTKNATFWFRVRAVNAHGANEWRQVKSIAPPCAVTGVQASHEPSADGQSGTISVSWDAAHRANGYDVNFTVDNGKSWERMVTGLRATSYQFTKHIPYNSNYRIAVQSRRKGVTSGWTSAPIKTVELTASDVGGTTATLNLSNYSGNWHYKADKTPHNSSCQGPVSGEVENLTGLDAGTAYTYTAYSDSTCASAIKSVAFTTPITLTATSDSDTAITLTIAGHSGAWWYQADTGPDSSCTGAGSVASVNRTGLAEHGTYTYTAYKDTDGDGDCDAGDALASTGSFTVSVDQLYVTNVAATTATLGITHHTEQWWYQANFVPDTGCANVAANTASVALTNLIPGTAYTYKAYSDSGCSTEVASETFTTAGVSVSNLDESETQICYIGAHQGFADRLECGAVFTTGSATNGYTLHNVTLKFLSNAGTPGTFNIALYEASGDYPAASPIQNATLSGSAPLAAGDYTYTCAGSGCDLRKETKYVVAMSSPDSSHAIDNQYRWRTTTSSNESPYPSNNGWSIADKAVGRFGGSWYKESAAGMFKVAATVK